MDMMYGGHGRRWGMAWHGPLEMRGDWDAIPQIKIRMRRHEHGPHGRHGGEGPGWFGRGPRVGRGDVRAAALLLLEEQPLHGYQIIQRIEEQSGGLWRPSAGSVYPALQLLEDEGLVRAEQTQDRRVYYLTDAGRSYIAEHRATLVAARDAVTAGIDGGVLELRTLYHQLGDALRQVGQTGAPAQLDAARGVLTNARRQLYRILAEDAGTGPEEQA
jgi:DNA-binding PadR family transcriptional regulator